MNSSYLKKIYPILLSILMLACADNKATNETLDIAIDNLILENLRTINRMKASVKDMGMREDDVVVVEATENIYKAKVYFNLPFESKDFAEHFELSNALNFLDSLKATYSIKKVTIDKHILSSIDELLNDDRIETSTRNRLIYINIIKLESEFINNRLMRIGFRCNLSGCFTLTLNSNSDTIKVGDSFESILTINEQWATYEKATYDSVTVTVDGIPVNYEDRQIGNAHQLLFRAEKAGTYKYSGVLITENEEFDYRLSCDFEFNIVSR